MMALWKYKGLIAGGVMLLVIAVLLLRIESLGNKIEAKDARIGVLVDERDAAIDAAHANAAAFEKAQAERDSVVAILDSVREADLARGELVKEIAKEVHSAKPSDCPAADALTAAHRGVRKLTERKAGD